MNEEQGNKWCRLNDISAMDLTNVPGISRSLAEKIIFYRNMHGPFHDWDDLRNISGIRQTLIDRLRSKCELETPQEDRGQKGGAD